MKSLTKLTLLSCLLGASFGAQSAAISLTNQDFETGDLGGWTILGNAFATGSTSVTTFDGTIWTVGAADTTMAQLAPQGLSVSSIESSLGIASGTLNGFNTNPDGGSLTDGAAIYQTFSGMTGDTLSMAWDYVATDYIPFNDPAFAVIIAPDSSVYVEVLASIHGLGIPVGTSGHSGWQTFNYALTQDGNYTIAFVTTNDKDTVLDSVLFIDNVPGSAVSNVPEPASLALLGIGALGFAAMRRRKSV